MARAKAKAPRKCSAWFPNRPVEGRERAQRGLHRGSAGPPPGLPRGLRRGSAAGGPHPCRGSRAGNRPRPRRAPRRLPPPSPRAAARPAAPPWRPGRGQREAAPSRHAPGPAGTAALAGSGHHRGGSGRATSLPQCPAQWGRRGLGRSRARRGPGARGECGGRSGGGTGGRG